MIVYQTRQRHWHVSLLGRRQHQAHVLEPVDQLEARGIEAALDHQAPVVLVHRRAEQMIVDRAEEPGGIDRVLLDEGQAVRQGLQHGAEHEVAAQLYHIGQMRLGANPLAQANLIYS